MIECNPAADHTTRRCDGDGDGIRVRHHVDRAVGSPSDLRVVVDHWQRLHRLCAFPPMTTWDATVFYSVPDMSSVMLDVEAIVQGRGSSCTEKRVTRTVSCP